MDRDPKILVQESLAGSFITLGDVEEKILTAEPFQKLENYQKVDVLTKISDAKASIRRAMEILGRIK